MRVRCIESTEYNDLGDVIIIKDNDQALLDIENGYYDRFDYTSSDDEIVNRCEKDFRCENFESLYIFILEIYEIDKVNNITLKDGRKG
jgi:hypothetical protein